MKKRQGLIFVISGPSGSGKTTLIKNLLKDKSLKELLTKSISFTTRTKRKGEKEARDYFFIKPERFKQLLKRRRILEWTKYLDDYYGTPKDYVDGQLNKGKSIVLCLDTRGAATVKRLYPDNAVRIFVLPPKIEALRQRIHWRSKGKGEQNLTQRLVLAKKEIAQARSYDYQIVNDELRSALKSIKKIVIQRIDGQEVDR